MNCSLRTVALPGVPIRGLLSSACGKTTHVRGEGMSGAQRAVRQCGGHCRGDILSQGGEGHTGGTNRDLDMGRSVPISE